MNILKDKYFKYPLLSDLMLGMTLIGLLELAIQRQLVCYPTNPVLLQVSTDISTVSLTLAGFILTFLTVLITFKMGSTSVANEGSMPRLIDIFFNSSLYFKSITLLQGCIGTLIFSSILGFVLKLFLKESALFYLLYSSIFGIAMIITTISRSLFILRSILSFQKTDNQDEEEYR
jgi:hypothetical protein